MHIVQNSNIIPSNLSINTFIVNKDALKQYSNYHQQKVYVNLSKQHDEITLTQSNALQKKKITEQKYVKVIKQQHVRLQKIVKYPQNHQQIIKKQEFKEKVAKKTQKKQQQIKTIVKVKKYKNNQAKIGTKLKKTADITAKESITLKNLLSKLTDTKKNFNLNYKPIEIDKNNVINANSTEINTYKMQIKQAISDKFYDSFNYSGKTCNLSIQLAPDGMLISVSFKKGDPLLCRKAVSAVNLANMPKPPSQQVYEVFKNITLQFSPP